MQTAAIEALQDLTLRWIWPALVHSVWIGLLAASISALIMQAAGRLSHRARHGILLGALALVTAGPAIATILERTSAVATGSKTTSLWVIAASSKRDGERLIQSRVQSSQSASAEFGRSQFDLGRFEAGSFATISIIATENPARCFDCVVLRCRNLRKLHDAGGENRSSLASRIRACTARDSHDMRSDGPTTRDRAGAFCSDSPAGRGAFSLWDRALDNHFARTLDQDG